MGLTVAQPMIQIKDDHLLELAVASGAGTIVTHNTRHFVGLASFAVRAVTPRQLLEEMR